MGVMDIFRKRDDNAPPEVGEEDAFEKAKAARQKKEAPSMGKEDVLNKIKTAHDEEESSYGISLADSSNKNIPAPMTTAMEKKSVNSSSAKTSSPNIDAKRLPSGLHATINCV